MQRARRASWRLTFTVWSTLLVVLGLVTVTLGRRSLLMIERLVGKDDRVAITVVALLVALPLLVDAIRNLPHYRGAWRRRALRRAASAAEWTRRAPVETPRRFRGGPTLTRRERTVVEQGQLAFGCLVRHGELWSVRYEAPWGGTLGSMPVAPAGAPPREGERAALLFDPGEHTGVAPSLLGLDFRAGEAPDARSALAAPARERQPRTGSLTLPLWATLHPVERLGQRRALAVGELRLEDGRLTLAVGEGAVGKGAVGQGAIGQGEPVTVRLDQPVRVELSVHLRTDGMAELALLVEPARSSAYRAAKPIALRFKTELPQGRIDRRIGRRWVDACYVAPDDFLALWPHLVAAAGDEALGDCVA